NRSAQPHPYDPKFKWRLSPYPVGSATVGPLIPDKATSGDDNKPPHSRFAATTAVLLTLARTVRLSRRLRPRAFLTHAKAAERRVPGLRQCSRRCYPKRLDCWQLLRHRGLAAMRSGDCA
ncbi:MAG: hypothetical protein WBW61_02390, partial [Rhodanobacteraceae bacterium]